MSNDFCWRRALTRTVRTALPFIAAGSVECAVHAEFHLSPAWRRRDPGAHDPHSDDEPRADEPSLTYSVLSNSTGPAGGITGRVDIQLPMVTVTGRGTVTG